MGSGEGRTLVESQVAGRPRLHEQRLLHRTVPPVHAAVLVSEDLGEVPRDGISQDALPLGPDFHPLPQQVATVPFMHILLYVSNLTL